LKETAIPSRTDPDAGVITTLPPPSGCTLVDMLKICLLFTGNQGPKGNYRKFTLFLA
jgi:hypothetical protein